MGTKFRVQVRANIISWEGNKVVWINIVHFFFVVVLGHGQVITNEWCT